MLVQERFKAVGIEIADAHAPRPVSFQIIKLVRNLDELAPAQVLINGVAKDIIG